jgi:hypothetical protein
MNEYDQLQQSLLYKNWILQHREYAESLGFDFSNRFTVSKLMRAGFLFEEFLEEFCYDKA